MSVYGGLADRIRDHRKALKLTQSGLAERAGLSFATIQALERGASNPERKTLAAIATALDISIGDLLGETVEPAPMAARSITQEAAMHPTLKDVVVILDRLESVSPERRAAALAILFDDSSLAPESFDLAQLASTKR